LIVAIFLILMGILGRLSGNGFGQKWGVSWLPEALMCVPYGVALGSALGYALWPDKPYLGILLAFAGFAVSYAGMQSATWHFLRWETHTDPNTERTATIKPLVDFIAARFGYSLGQEGYAWIAAMVKGFIIGLPVGGFITAIGWAVGYEIGSHAHGRVKFDPHAVSEFMSSALGAIGILVFLWLMV